MLKNISPYHDVDMKDVFKKIVFNIYIYIYIYIHIYI